MATVSPNLIRAILEYRTNKHEGEHTGLLLLWQGLVAELVASDAIIPERLGDRLDYAFGSAISDHGEAARSLVAHAADWVRALESDKAGPAPTPDRWLSLEPLSTRPD
jgi:hypothetical protein